MRLRTLDRYMIAELAGPCAFGLSAFTLIFAATQILAISRLVATEHAPLGAAVAYFLWQMPAIVVLVVPMAMLLGTLLAMQRLSSESELIAMKAGGVGLIRAVAAPLVLGLVVSLIALWLQEAVVPYANDRAAYLRTSVISRVGAFAGAGSSTVSTGVPGGGRQVTTWASYDAAAQALINVTLIQYDASGRPQAIIFSDRAQYHATGWTFTNASEYHFYADGETVSQQVPQQTLDIGEKPSQVLQRGANDNPENMSRAQIRQVLASGQLGGIQVRAYVASYAEKLARPFASFVFTLIAIPFGLQALRGSGTGAGFGLAVSIVFVYFVVASIFSAVSTALSANYAVAVLGAWAPNVIFTAFAATRLAAAARA